MTTKILNILITFLIIGFYVVFPQTSYAADQEVSINDNVLTGTNRFEYSGNWLYNYTGAPLEYNADVHVSQTSGSYATFYFTGTQAKLYGVKADYFGIAGVSVDGGPETMIDFYSPTLAHQALMHISPALTSGPHTLRIRVTGNRNNQSGGIYIIIDRMVIITQNTCDKAHGDANCDGVVNLTDFESWRREFIGELTTKTADFNNDNLVNLTDFESWRNGFNISP